MRPFRERSGNAGLVARELPSDEVLASRQHVEQRALDLRAAGLPGSLRELRIRAYLDQQPPDGNSDCGTGPPGTGPPGSSPLLTTPLTPIARGSCDHAHGQAGYHPTRQLTHLIRARSATCTAPGCQRPAARCDLDHTHPWDQGGATCECNLAPLCRHHHRCKQAEGWSLEQPEPGVLTWRTPSGRTYATTPTQYTN